MASRFKELRTGRLRLPIRFPEATWLMQPSVWLRNPGAMSNHDHPWNLVLHLANNLVVSGQAPVASPRSEEQRQHHREAERDHRRDGNPHGHRLERTTGGLPQQRLQQPEGV